MLGTVWGIILIHFELFILHFIIFDSLIIFVVLMNVPFHPTFLKIMFARVFHPLGDLAAFIQPDAKAIVACWDMNPSTNR